MIGMKCLRLEYEKAPELSSVRVVGTVSNGVQPVKAQKSVARAENSMEAMSAATKECKVMHRLAMYADILQYAAALVINV